MSKIIQIEGKKRPKMIIEEIRSPEDAEDGFKTPNEAIGLEI